MIWRHGLAQVNSPLTIREEGQWPGSMAMELEVESCEKDHRTKLEKDKGVLTTWCAGLQKKNSSVSEGSNYMKVLKTH